jgi:hypothetical protein
LCGGVEGCVYLRDLHHDDRRGRCLCGGGRGLQCVAGVAGAEAWCDGGGLGGGWSIWSGCGLGGRLNGGTDARLYRRLARRAHDWLPTRLCSRKPSWLCAGLLRRHACGLVCWVAGGAQHRLHRGACRWLISRLGGCEGGWVGG